MSVYIGMLEVIISRMTSYTLKCCSGAGWKSTRH